MARNVPVKSAIWHEMCHLDRQFPEPNVQLVVLFFERYDRLFNLLEFQCELVTLSAKVEDFTLLFDLFVEREVGKLVFEFLFVTVEPLDLLPLRLDRLLRFF